jgi:hypothetical protein
VSTESQRAHRQTWDLIPWIVNDSVAPSEHQAAQAHLQDCANCQAELQFQRHLQSLMQSRSVPPLDAQAGWQRLSARLDLPTGTQAQSPRGRERRGWLPWAAAALVIESVALGALGTALWWRGQPGAASAASAATAAPLYRTLSAAASAPPPATIRVVFVPQMTIAQLHAVLAAAHLQVVAGPSAAGVWSLGPATDSNRAATETALRQLRSSSDVRFAEPVDAMP